MNFFWQNFMRILLILIYHLYFINFTEGVLENEFKKGDIKILEGCCKLYSFGFH